MVRMATVGGLEIDDVVRPYLEAALHPDIRILIGSERPGVQS
jgi:hypothetical protein